MYRTTSASSSTTISLPNLSLSYPNRLFVDIIGTPFLNRSITDHVIAALLASDSPCATRLITPKVNSFFASIVFRFTSSKNTPTGGDKPFRTLTTSRQSLVFLANRLTLFVTMRSIFPSLQSCIIR